MRTTSHEPQTSATFCSQEASGNSIRRLYAPAQKTEEGWSHHCSPHNPHFLHNITWLYRSYVTESKHGYYYIRIGQSCCLRNIHALTCSFAGYTSSMSSFNSTHSMLYATVLHVQTSEFGRYRLASSGGCRPRRGCPAPLSCCTPQSVGSRQLDRSVCYPSDWLFP